jgi:hypothetical protein
MKSNDLPPLELLRNTFDYNPATGDLIWKVSRGSIKAGQVAGCQNSPEKPYVKVHLAGKSYLAHRLIYKWVHGEDIPEGKLIDHINGKKDDNRIDNLRVLSNADNVYLAKPAKHNKSGVRGVTFIKQREMWEVQHRGVYIGSYHHFGVAVEVKRGLDKYEQSVMFQNVTTP